MSDHQNRRCLNELIALSAQTDTMDHRAVAAKVDQMLACNGRRACTSHLACSWLAADLAASLADRYR
ncbi:MAG TPA: hypothetical protein VK196_16675 [Magnetospirillum sp.]|nr:hypothetical protein [Magnetospirillum sp.]